MQQGATTRRTTTSSRKTSSSTRLSLAHISLMGHGTIACDGWLSSIRSGQHAPIWTLESEEHALLSWPTPKEKPATTKKQHWGGQLDWWHFLTTTAISCSAGELRGYIPSGKETSYNIFRISSKRSLNDIVTLRTTAGDNDLQQLRDKNWQQSIQTTTTQRQPVNNLQLSDNQPTATNSVNRQLSVNSYDHDDHLKEVVKPWAGKMPRKMFQKVLALNGVPKKQPKKCSGFCATVEVMYARAPGTLFSTSLSTPFGASTFWSTLLGNSLARGFGTSLNGRHDRRTTVENRQLSDNSQQLATTTMWQKASSPKTNSQQQPAWIIDQCAAGVCQQQLHQILSWTKPSTYMTERKPDGVRTLWEAWFCLSGTSYRPPSENRLEKPL